MSFLWYVIRILASFVWIPCYISADSVIFRGIEYIFPDEKKNWDAAEAYCVTQEGHLAAIHDQATQDLLQGELQKRGWRKAWIGGQDSVGDWHWVSDNSAISPQGCFNEKKNDRDLPKTRKSKTVTPKNCIRACKDFKYAGISDGKLCYCGDSYGKHGETIGCTLGCNGDKFKYMCGGKNKNSIYKTDGGWAEWIPGEPNDVRSSLSCGTINKNKNFAFSDDKCSNPRMYICDIGEPDCKLDEEGYIEIEEKCYFVSKDVKRFSEARSDCIARGGDLVKIVDEKQRDSMANELSKIKGLDKVFIGLTPGAWMWTTGNYMTYKKLGGGLPSTTGRLCLYMSAVEEYKWVLILCFWPYNFICQKLGPPTTPTVATSPTTSAITDSSNEPTRIATVLPITTTATTTATTAATTKATTKAAATTAATTVAAPTTTMATALSIEQTRIAPVPTTGDVSTTTSNPTTAVVSTPSTTPTTEEAAASTTTRLTTAHQTTPSVVQSPQTISTTNRGNVDSLTTQRFTVTITTGNMLVSNTQLSSQTMPQIMPNVGTSSSMQTSPMQSTIPLTESVSYDTVKTAASMIPTVPTCTTPDFMSTKTQIKKTTQAFTIKTTTPLSMPSSRTFIPDRTPLTTETIVTPTQSIEDVKMSDGDTTLLIVGIVCIGVIGLTALVSALAYLFVTSSHTSKVYPVHMDSENGIGKWQGDRITVEE